MRVAGRWQVVALVLLVLFALAAAVMTEDDEDLQRHQAMEEAKRLRQQTGKQGTPGGSVKARQPIPDSTDPEKKRQMEQEQQRLLRERQQQHQLKNQQQNQKQQRSEGTAANSDSSSRSVDREQKQVRYEGNRQLVEMEQKEKDREEQSASRAEKKLRAEQSTPQAESLYNHGRSLVEAGDYEGAIPFLERAADGGHALAMLELGDLYQYGIGVESDFAAAFKCYSQSAALGLPAAQRSLAFFLETGKGTEPNIPLALLYYTFAARGRDVEAHHVLAYKYLKGYGVVASCSHAVQHFKPVAEHVIEEIDERGYDITQTAHLVQLAEYSKTKEDEAAHDVELLDYIHFAAQNGDATSQGDLGRVYLFGLYHEEKDYELSRYYLNLAHEQGDAKATAFLGKLYEFGYGVDVDIERAADLYREASDGGSAHGHCFLGKLYRSGKSSTLGRDYAMAIDHLKKSIALNNFDAAVELGLLYYNGLGVPRSYESAFSYFRSAALHDNAKGQLHTARMLQYGIGTAADCSQAVQFYNKLCTKGSWRLDFEVAFSRYMEGDMTQALLLYEMLAERGMVEAQTNVAWFYDTDTQPEQFTQWHQPIADNSEAFPRHRLALKYYKRSADQGNELSHLKLGDYHYYGLGGLEADPKQAAAFYRYVSTISPQAKFNLGYMYHHGIGLDKDLALAKRFFDESLAANPEGFLPVKLALSHLALDYGYEKYLKGEFVEALWELAEYVYPSFFAEPPPPTSPNTAAAAAAAAAKTANPKGTDSIWDEVLIFGLQVDTVALFLLGGILILVVMMRNQLVRVRVQGGRMRR